MSSRLGLNDKRRKAVTVAAFQNGTGPLASVEGEKRGIRLGFPHHRLIRDNHGCSRLYFVGDFLGKFWAEMQPRRQLLRLDGATFAGHTHPPACLASGRKLTRLSGRTLQQSKNMTSETIASTNLKRRASDGITIAIHVDRTIRRA